MIAKTVRQETPHKPAATPDSTVPRRGLMFGLGVAGAAAVAVKLMPGAAPAAAVSPGAKVAADATAGDGYRVTPHVKRYYETTQS